MSAELFAIGDILDAKTLLLVGGGFVIGIFAVIFGAAMFFSVPLMQGLFPEASFGVVIGNLKMGSFFRSIGSTASTWRHIEYAKNLKLSLIAFLGTFAGTSFIADMDQKWLLPGIGMAIVFAVLSPRVAHKITGRTFNIAAFATGVYAGLFGAGIGVILIALLRLKHPKDTDIAFVKIQARFIEWMLVTTALATHFFHHNLVGPIWIPWSIGSIAGGYIGGILLRIIGKLPGKTQTYIMYASFALALAVAGWRFLCS